MKRHQIISRVTAVFTGSLLICSCGGGGGSSSTGSNGNVSPDNDSSPQTPTYSVEATFIKGLVDGATCELFEVSNTGALGSPITFANTSSGNVNFGNQIDYQGTALINCVGGTYTDCLLYTSPSPRDAQ